MSSVWAPGVDVQCAGGLSSAEQVIDSGTSFSAGMVHFDMQSNSGWWGVVAYFVEINVVPKSEERVKDMLNFIRFKSRKVSTDSKWSRRQIKVIWNQLHGSLLSYRRGKVSIAK